MDPITEVVSLLRPHAVFSKPITAKGRWGVRYAAYEQPGFAIVLRGRCWLAAGGQAPHFLDRGDFVLFPATPAFSMLSDPEAPVSQGLPSMETVRHGELDGDPDFEMLGGSFRLDPANASMVLGLLPDMVHIRGSEGGTTRLQQIVALIMDECGADRPAKALVLQRLLEVMLFECLRRPDGRQGKAPAGLLAGMEDAALARVLRAMHAGVGEAWTVASLAEVACMSRSAFSARFSAILGCAPMEYLSRWRMSLAQNALASGGETLERIAVRIGYESASAFSTAFRKRLGCSPGRFASLHRTSGTTPAHKAV